MKITKTKLREIIRQSIKEEQEYDEYFRGILKKYGVQSPADLSDEEKSKFFTDVDKGWTAKNEGELDELSTSPRQLVDKRNEMMVVKNGKVHVIDKDDWSSYKKNGYGVAESVNEYDEWHNTRTQAKNIFRMLKQKYSNNISKMRDGLEDILKQNKTKNDQAEVVRQEFNKYFKVKESSINESNYDLMFGKLGSGITVSNKKVTDPNTKDYKFVAHISDSGKIDWKDKEAQKNATVRREVEKKAKSMNESDDCGCGSSKINEGNAFGMAVTKAKQEGKKEFEFNGKTYKVKPGSYEKNEAAKESVTESVSVFDERHFGKKGIIIMIDDGGKKVSAIFKDKKNADKYNRNNPADVKKLLDLAKKTPYPNTIDESVNKAKLTEEEIKWNAVQNAIINFLKMNTKILDKRVQAKDTDGVKGGLKSIISGLTNAQRNLKLESVNEGAMKPGKKIKLVLGWAGKNQPTRNDKYVVYQLVNNRHFSTKYSGGMTYLWKAIESTDPRIKVGSTEEIHPNELKNGIKHGYYVMESVTKESVNEENPPKGVNVSIVDKEIKRRGKKNMLKHFQDIKKDKLYTKVNTPQSIDYLINYVSNFNESVNEAELPKDGSTIKVGNTRVEIKYVGKNKDYVGFSWKGDDGKSNYEETKVSAHKDMNSLINTIKDEIRYQRVVVSKRKTESVNEGKHDVMLDKLASIVKDAKSFMDVGRVLKSNGIKYSFSTSMIPMYRIDKQPIAIVNKKYAAGAEREIGDIAIGLLESIRTK